MFSNRIPAGPESNAWNLRLTGLRASGAPLLDLTVTNPTAAGLAVDVSSLLARLGDPGSALYEPDPRGIRSAREAVASYYAGHRTRVHPDQVVLTASTSEAYAHLFRLLTDPGQVFLAPTPSYPLFEPLAALESSGVRPYPLRYAGRWWLDRAALTEAAGDPAARGIVLVQPNNPTGSLLDDSEVEWVAGLARDRGLPLLADEVFLDAVTPGDGPAARSQADRADVLTFTMSGLSKVCGLPQLKLGWIVVSGPEAERRRAIEGLEWIADTFLSVATPVQRALPALLNGRHQFLAAAEERLAGNEARLRAALEGTPVSARPRQGGWSIILELPRIRRDEEWALELLDRGVVLHPGHFYDLAEEATLVASLMTPTSDWIQGLERLIAAVNGA